MLYRRRRVWRFCESITPAKLDGMCPPSDTALVVFHQQVAAEKAGDGSGDWATVKLTVGVTRDKLRTLVMQFYADAKVMCHCFHLSNGVSLVCV